MEVNEGVEEAVSCLKQEEDAANVREQKIEDELLPQILILIEVELKIHQLCFIMTSHHNASQISKEKRRV